MSGCLLGSRHVSIMMSRLRRAAATLQCHAPVTARTPRRDRRHRPPTRRHHRCPRHKMYAEQDSSLDNLGKAAIGSGVWNGLQWTSQGKPREAASVGRAARGGWGRRRRWSDDYHALSAIWAQRGRAGLNAAAPALCRTEIAANGAIMAVGVTFRPCDLPSGCHVPVFPNSRLPMRGILVSKIWKISGKRSLMTARIIKGILSASTQILPTDGGAVSMVPIIG